VISRDIPCRAVPQDEACIVKNPIEHTMNVQYFENLTDSYRII